MHRMRGTADGRSHACARRSRSRHVLYIYIYIYIYIHVYISKNAYILLLLYISTACMQLQMAARTALYCGLQPAMYIYIYICNGCIYINVYIMHIYIYIYIHMLRHEAWQHLSIDRILQRRPRGTRLGCASGSIMYCLGVYLYNT